MHGALHTTNAESGNKYRTTVVRASPEWIKRYKHKFKPTTRFFICFRDLAINFLSSLHKYTFQDLSHVVELDIFDNQIDFLPESIFEYMDSLVNL